MGGIGGVTVMETGGLGLLVICITVNICRFKRIEIFLIKSQVHFQMTLCQSFWRLFSAGLCITNLRINKLQKKILLEQLLVGHVAIKGREKLLIRQRYSGHQNIFS